MIESLYPCFQHWSKNGGVYIVSDTHFKDLDRKLMGYNISNEDQAYLIKDTCYNDDTLIHLGDVGDPKFLKKLKCHTVLIMGNHDTGEIKQYFDEVYTGPLWISEKIVLSHEPIYIKTGDSDESIVYNIHGHDHNGPLHLDNYHLNITQNVFGYCPLNLNQFIKSGKLKNIKNIHRVTIDNAIKQSKKKNVLKDTWLAWSLDTGVENV